MAKSKMAALKFLVNPRLELFAAATRKELQTPIDAIALKSFSLWNGPIWFFEFPTPEQLKLMEAGDERKKCLFQ